MISELFEHQMLKTACTYTFLLHLHCILNYYPYLCIINSRQNPDRYIVRTSQGNVLRLVKQIPFATTNRTTMRVRANFQIARSSLLGQRVS